MAAHKTTRNLACAASAVLAVSLTGLLAGCGSSSTASTTKTPPAPAGLSITGPGLQVSRPSSQLGQPAWRPEYAHLTQRLKLIGIPAGGKEKFHIHALLRIYVNGLLRPLPADIGIDSAKGIESSMHTHDGSGIIHMEAPHPYPYTLGDFFSVWGVKLGPAQVGGLKGYGGNRLHFYLNGKAAEQPRRARAAQRRQCRDRLWPTQRLSAQPEQVPAQRGRQRRRRPWLRRHQEGSEVQKLPRAQGAQRQVEDQYQLITLVRRRR